MNISETFIRRPIATSLLMAAIALFGIISYRALPVSDLPQVDSPTITVMAGLPGANPDTMASAVATPLERQFTTIAGERPDDLHSGRVEFHQGQFGSAPPYRWATADAAPRRRAILLPPGMLTPPSATNLRRADHQSFQ